MKGARVLLIAMGVLIALSLWAPVQAADQVWTTPQKITTSSAWSRGGPVVYGDKVYYNERRSVSNPVEIWVWDQAGGARLYMGGPDYLNVNAWAVYQDRVLFTRYANNQYGLYVHDPLTGDRLISATAGDFSNSPMASMYGDMVTWTDVRSGVKQVYTWDPVNGERHVNPTSYDQMNPRIWGNKVVYEDYRYVEDPRYGGGDPDIWTWNPLNGSQQLASGMTNPVIYRDDIYALKPGSDGWPPYTVSELWRFGPRGGRLATSTGAPSGAWGDLVVTDGLSWDPVHGLIHMSSIGGTQYSLYGRQAAWVNNNDIYVSTFVPEPGGLCSLSVLLAGACLSLRRRRRA